MSMYNGRIYCRYPYNIYDRNEQKRMGFHRKSKECLTKFEAERLAKKIGCGIFYCQYGKCWHLGKADA